MPMLRLSEITDESLELPEYLTFLAPEILRTIFTYLNEAHEGETEIKTVEDDTKTADDGELKAKGVQQQPLASLGATCSILHDEVKEFIVEEQCKKQRAEEAKKAAEREKAWIKKDKEAEIYYGYRMKHHFIRRYGSTGWESRGPEPTLPLTAATNTTPKGSRKHKPKSLSIDSTTANAGATFKPIIAKQIVLSPPPTYVEREPVGPFAGSREADALIAELMALASPVVSEPASPCYKVKPQVESKGLDLGTPVGGVSDVWLCEDRGVSREMTIRTIQWSMACMAGH